jgi:hypothetical protein
VFNDGTLVYIITSLSPAEVQIGTGSGYSNGHISGINASGTLTIPSQVTGGTGNQTYSVVAIGERAFYNCSGFTGSLTIPNSVTSIGEQAFYSCSGLTSVNCNWNTPPTINSTAIFANVTAIFNIPCNTLSAYQSTGWNLRLYDACVFDINTTEGINNLDCNVSYITLNSRETCPYSVSSIPYSPVCPLDSGTNVFVGDVGVDDVFSSVINLPFAFDFYGNTYNNMVVSSNGLISFNTGYAEQICPYSLALLPNIPSPVYSSSFKNAIYGVMQDMNPSYLTGSKGVRYAVTGTAPNRQFIVSFNEIPMFSVLTSATSQMVLHETSNAIEVYVGQRELSTSWNEGRGIVGIQNADGTQGIAAPGRNATDFWSVTDTPEAWRFVPQSLEWVRSGEVISTSETLVLHKGNNAVDIVVLRANNIDVDSVTVHWRVDAEHAICMVSVDDNSHNEIVWKKNELVDNYKIYREDNQSGQYDFVETVDYNSSNSWVDTESNAKSRSYRYRVSAIDSCGNESPLSSLHKTMHLTINAGQNNSWNLIWTEYEGVTFSTYNIYRYSGFSFNGFSTMELIGTMPSNNTSFSDFSAPSGSYVYYVVEIVLDEACNVTTPAFSSLHANASAGSTASILSNVATNDPETGLNEVLTSHISIYPNPATNKATVRIEGLSTQAQVTVTDLSGRIIETRTISAGSTETEINVSAYAGGVYLVRIVSNNVNKVEKLTVK